MLTEEIPRKEWASFFNGFSRRHKGWLVTVEVLGPDVGDQIEARELPLEGITAELRDSGQDQIEIFVGARPDSHVSHKITAPEHVYLKRSEQGADEALEIASKDIAALIRFRSAVPPETVDGVV
ncbi:MAG TPA: DUF5335 family protein [Blastocatellia bacterium]|nr:DUF5335 family protein [Blastocatellia bacterium]